MLVIITFARIILYVICYFLGFIFILWQLPRTAVRVTTADTKLKSIMTFLIFFSKRIFFPPPCCRRSYTSITHTLSRERYYYHHYYHYIIYTVCGRRLPLRVNTRYACLRAAAAKSIRPNVKHRYSGIPTTRVYIAQKWGVSSLIYTPLLAKTACKYIYIIYTFSVNQSRVLAAKIVLAFICGAWCILLHLK